MRETGFIEQNKEKWAKFEKVLEHHQRDPEELSELFIQVTDDLSYSRTFYPNRSVRVYLNNLAQKVFTKIYRNQRGKTSRFVHFWVEELPRINYECRRVHLISFLVFALSMAIGALSTLYDPEVPSVILGEWYVNMTERNIADEDPMRVYKEAKELDMFFSITYHNLRVAFQTFVYGAFFALGTLYFLVFNGVMVGAFQTFFYQKGVFLDSFLTIWVHGTLEISAIIIAGTAGLVMGSGLLFPGTYNRLQSFMISAKKGLKIMLGIAPVFVLAGFIEGFLTRYTDAPIYLRLGIIISSLLVILAYYWWYPRMKFRNRPDSEEEGSPLPPQREFAPNYFSIKTNGQVFSDTFSFYKKFFWKLIAFIGVGALLFTLLFQELAKDGPLAFFYVYLDYDYYDEAIGVMLENFIDFFDLIEGKIFAICALVTFPALATATYQHMVWFAGEKPKVKHPGTHFWLANYWKAVVLGGMAFLTLLLPVPWLLKALILFLAVPVFNFTLFVAIWEKKDPISALNRTLKLLSATFWRMVGLQLIVTLLSLLVVVLINTPFVYFYYEIVRINLDISGEEMNQLMVMLYLFMTMFIIHLLAPLTLVSSGIFYFSAREMVEASYLREQISNISKKKKRYGIEMVE